MEVEITNRAVASFIFFLVGCGIFQISYVIIKTIREIIKSYYDIKNLSKAYYEKIEEFEKKAERYSAKFFDSEGTK